MQQGVQGTWSTGCPKCTGCRLYGARGVRGAQGATLCPSPPAERPSASQISRPADLQAPEAASAAHLRVHQHQRRLRMRIAQRQSAQPRHAAPHSALPSQPRHSAPRLSQPHSRRRSPRRFELPPFAPLPLPQSRGSRPRGVRADLTGGGGGRPRWFCIALYIIYMCIYKERRVQREVQIVRACFTGGFRVQVRRRGELGCFQIVSVSLFHAAVVRAGRCPTHPFPPAPQ